MVGLTALNQQSDTREREEVAGGGGRVQRVIAAISNHFSALWSVFLWQQWRHHARGKGPLIGSFSPFMHFPLLFRNDIYEHIYVAVEEKVLAVLI